MSMSHEQAERLNVTLERLVHVVSTLSEDVVAATDALNAAAAALTAASGQGVSESQQAALENATTAVNDALTPSTPPPPASLSLPAQAFDVAVGAAVNSSVTADGGTPPYTFTSGNVPSGLTLGTDGVFSGSLAKAGSFDVTVDVADSAGASASGSVTITAA